MVYYIFRKADSALLYAAYTEAQHASEKASCLSNEGGVEADYVYVTSETPPPLGMVAVLSESNEVEFQINPIREARRLAKEAGKAKLVGLGLTNDEIDALTG